MNSMALVNYSSSSSDSDNSVENGDENGPQSKKTRHDASRYQITNRTKLPSALEILLSSKNNKIDHIDDPDKHDGRMRTFKHERGNWVTYVYIPVDLQIFEDAQEFCQKALRSYVDMRVPNDVLHISLSKTVILQYHVIDSFVQTLGTSFSSCKSFSISLKHLKVYSNEEKTRTFMAFKVDDVHYEQVRMLMHKVDVAMLDYKQPLFYEHPSFHISFLWCLGDQVELLNLHLAKLSNELFQQNENAAFIVDVNCINCTSGNKQFIFKLKK